MKPTLNSVTAVHEEAKEAAVALNAAIAERALENQKAAALHDLVTLRASLRETSVALKEARELLKNRRLDVKDLLEELDMIADEEDLTLDYLQMLVENARDLLAPAMLVVAEPEIAQQIVAVINEGFGGECECDHGRRGERGLCGEIGLAA